MKKLRIVSQVSQHKIANPNVRHTSPSPKQAYAKPIKSHQFSVLRHILGYRYLDSKKNSL